MSDLERQLADALGGGEISHLTRLSGGASRETYAFEHDGEPLILQRERPGASRPGGGMRSEALLLRAAALAGVPVAELIASGDADSPLGAPFIVTRRLEGETIARKILRDDEWAPVRPTLAAQCGEALAAVHEIPLDAAPELEQQDQIGQYRGALDLLGEPHPAFELGFRWLERHRPSSERVSVVHGDFRHGNFIVDKNGLAAVLDWDSHISVIRWKTWVGCA